MIGSQGFNPLVGRNVGGKAEKGGIGGIGRMDGKAEIFAWISGISRQINERLYYSSVTGRKGGMLRPACAQPCATAQQPGRKEEKEGLKLVK